MKHEFILKMRNKKILTTAEYMVLFNFHFGNWERFLRDVKISKKRLRELYCLGVNKIIKYKRLEIAQNL